MAFRNTRRRRLHVKEICDERRRRASDDHQRVGRAMVAHQAVLVFNVLGWSGFARSDVPQTLTAEERERDADAGGELFDEYCGINDVNYMEYYHDAQISKERVAEPVQPWVLHAGASEPAERLFFRSAPRCCTSSGGWTTCPMSLRAGGDAVGHVLLQLRSFSRCRTVWAIDQLFPIMPIIVE